MKRATLLAILVLTVYPCFASAGEVPIVDSSFEHAAATYPVTFNVGNPTPYTPYTSGWWRDETSGGSRMMWVDGSNTTWNVPMNNRDGNMALFCAQNSSMLYDLGGGNYQPGYIGSTTYQTVYLEAGNTYTLTVGVGTSAAVSKCDARFGLAFAPAPTVPLQYQLVDPYGYVATRPPVLAEIEGIIPNMSGEFVDYSVSFTPTESNYYNIAMQNRGFVAGTGADNGTSTVWFDNVRLTYVPEPVSALLLIGGFVMGIRRKRSA